MIHIYAKIFFALFGSIVRLLIALGILAGIAFLMLETGVVDIGINRPSDAELLRWFL